MADTPVADIGLILEGTYPYVLGGVSAWVDQIIKGLPEITFTIFYIGAKKDPNAKVHYALPPNVLGIHEVHLHDPLPDAELTPGPLDASERQRLYGALEAFYLAPSAGSRVDNFWHLIDALTALRDRVRFGNLARDPEAWDTLKKVYQSFAPNESFIDFFWSSRFLHLPLWQLWRALDRVPAARAYHAPSAGYAGLVGALAARARQVPFLLTEHGIYTKERMTEISQADWIYEGDPGTHADTGGLGPLKRMWINLFMTLGHIAYERARHILTLYEGNAHVEIEFGANPAKIQVIPNGIEPSKFDAIRTTVANRWNPEPPRKFVGFVGRVVPIKDVKTLLRAARIVIEQAPTTEFLIAGPNAEDPAYFEDCCKIVKLLNIEDKVHFLGMQKLMEILPRMDVMVLTSISEGLPLVVLEAMAAGIPVVATDVGACRELVFGRAPEDRALGRAGRLTKILSPQETASALLFTLKDPAAWRRMGEAGRLRAERFYSMKSMLGSYRDLYRDATQQPPTPASPWPASASN